MDGTNQTVCCQGEDRGNCMKYEFHTELEIWLMGILALPLLVFGLLANMCSARIFATRQMRSQSVNWYLFVKALSDSVILAGSFFVLTLPRFAEFSQWWLLSGMSARATPLMFGWMMMAQTVSVWMTTAMSVHRFVGVCMPFRARQLLSASNVRYALAMVLASACIFNVTRFFEINVTEECYLANVGARLPIMQPSPLRENNEYKMVYFTWFYTLVMFATPFTILILVNSLVIFAVHRSRRVHSKLSVQCDDLRRQELAKEISTSVMLVAVVLAFLFCNTLAFAVNILENLGANEIVETLVPWSNLLVITNASMNIFIYYLFSERYRQLLTFYLLRPCDGRKKGDIIFEPVFSSL